MAPPNNPKQSAQAQAKAAAAKSAADASASAAKGLNPKSAEVEERTQQLSDDIERLRVFYEHYFLGRERVAPQTLRTQVDRALTDLLQNLSQVANTSLKFRIKSLQAKLISLRRYWDRTLQEIEDGVYRRDRFKLKLHEREAEEKRKKAGSKSGKAQPEATAEKPAAATRNSTLETLMNQFVDAKKKCNENTGNLSYEAFAKTIASQSAAIKKQYNCKSVRFKVVIENGKTKLKATPV